MDMVESNPGQEEAYAENPQRRKENGILENSNEGFTQDSKNSPLLRTGWRTRQGSGCERVWTLI